MTMEAGGMAEGKIIAFCCNWCAYAAADLAGTLKMECDEHLRVIRVMCSGMVNPSLVVEAFHRGAEGVIIMGCRPGECHYVDGNDKAMARAEMIVELLSDLGFDKKRFAFTDYVLLSRKNLLL